MNVDNLAGPYPPNIVPLAARSKAYREPFEAWWSLPMEAWLRRRDSDRHDVAFEAWQAGHAAGVAEERERCAKVCEAQDGYWISTHKAPLHSCAAAIRKGEQK